MFKEDFESGLKPSWAPVKFQGLTRYAVVKEGTNSVLRASAAQSASGLAQEINIPASGKLVLSWRWKIDRTPPGGSETRKNTFDHSARIFVAFKSTLTPRTVNYVWANTTPIGQAFHHPSSGRGRFIVLETGNAKAGQWVNEKRDLLADWKALFGDEEPPAIVGIGLMTDSDGTQSTVTGYYDDLLLQRE